MRIVKQPVTQRCLRIPDSAWNEAECLAKSQGCSVTDLIVVGLNEVFAKYADAPVSAALSPKGDYTLKKGATLMRLSEVLRDLARVP